MNSIIVYGLINCGNCKFITKKLNENNVSHVFINCEDYSDRCDFLEKLTGCYTYPMIDIVEKDFSGTGKKEKHTIIHLETEYSKESGKKSLDTSHMGVQVLTLDEMFDQILFYKNK